MSIKSPDFDTLERLCARRSAEFDRLESAAFDYAGAERMDRPIVAACRKHSRLLDRMPTGYQEHIVGALVLHAIFGSETARSKFLRRSGYATEDREAFAALCDRPWRLAFLQIHERLSEGFFSIRVFGDPGEIVLFSPGIEKIEVAGRPLILCGIFGDDTCLQTFGSIIDLPAFDMLEVETFAKIASPDSYSASGLSGVLGRDPLPFLLLANFGQHRIAFGNSGALQYAAGTFRYREDFAEQAKKLGAAVVSKGATSIDLQPEDRPDSFVKLVLDGKRSRCTLVAASALAYREAASRPPLLGLAPADPEYQASPPMILAIGEILGKPFPGIDLKRGSGSNEAESKDGALDSLNAAFREYTDITNTRTAKPDARAIARKHGTDPERFAEFVATFESDFERRFHIDVPGGIQGFVPPPPAVRMEFSDSLAECALFDFHADEKVDSLLAAAEASYRAWLPMGTRGTINSTRLPGLLERATKERFGSGARTALSYTLFILLESGDECHSVRDYGSEVLKTFWQTLLPDRDAEHVEDFLESYARWIREVLEAFGIVIAGKSTGDADFPIQRSPMLEMWISLRK